MSGSGVSRSPEKGPGHRFPKSRRIRKRSDFLRIQERPAGNLGPKSARVTTPHFVLLLSGREPPSEKPLLPCRLGIVASKKVGGAVERNRAKRLLREAFRLNPGLFPQGIDLVIIVRPGAPELTYERTSRELSSIASLLARRALEVLRK